MGPQEVMECLEAWHSAQSSPASSSGGGDSEPSLQDAIDLKLFQEHRKELMLWKSRNDSVKKTGYRQTDEKNKKVRHHMDATVDHHFTILRCSCLFQAISQT